MPLIFQVAVSSFLLASFIFLSATAVLWGVWPLAYVGTASAVAAAGLAAQARCRWQRAARYLDASAP